MNYLSVVNTEYLEKSEFYDYGLGRGLFCERLFGCVLEELKIDPQEIDRLSFLAQVKNLTLLEKMIKNLCKNMNQLDLLETESLINSGVMQIIIMEIWLSLKSFYNDDEREVALKHLLELIENEVVIELLNSMDAHFKQHHFRADPLKSQF
ncbi:hypothetical protein OAK06_08490 [Gammaproteobacteria bacterium]|nr:hypothetical protein [Gammaproteobacteria bacterium]